MLFIPSYIFLLFAHRFHSSILLVLLCKGKSLDVSE